MAAEACYKDQPALRLDSPELSALILPQQGGKLASLVYKPTGREVLFQAPGAVYKPHAYGGCYTDSECSGFDDMFPTIDACHCEDFPWRGTPLPDHGEVCALPMRHRVSGNGLWLGVHGVRLPYIFEKRIHFLNTHTLRIDYRVRNRSDFGLNCLWAAHPIIDAGDGGEILLPFPPGEPATCVFSAGANGAAYGDALVWPQGGANGPLGDLSAVDEHLRGKAYKLYFRRPAPRGDCGFRWLDDGCELHLRYPAARVPWLGVLAGEHAPTGRLQVFLEPCTGGFDRPDMARLQRQNSVLPPQGEWRWTLDFDLHTHQE